MLPILKVKALLSEAVGRIRDFETRLAAAHGQLHFDWSERLPNGDYGQRGVLELPDGDLHYDFHGRGCTVTHNDIVLDYNYVRYVEPPAHCPLLFEPWTFTRTILSLSEGDLGSSLSQELMQAGAAWLRQLEVEGVVTKLPEGLASYEVNEAVLSRSESAA